LLSTILLLCLAAFVAGFVDAIVGGGGLIQLPFALVMLPQYPVHTVVGSLKIPAFTGTLFATIQYLKRVKINWQLVAICASIAFVMAGVGSYVLSIVSSRFMKPVILVVLILVAIYTFIKKDFGQSETKTLTKNQWIKYSIVIAIIVGFYDGFIGPGAGSILIMLFVTTIGYDFIKASAHAKLINLSTNLGSIIFFVAKGSILYKIAIPMAIANGLGGMAGAKLALLKGNKMVRIFFLCIITCIILRFGYDLFAK
jgi:uncharacterized protein